MTPGELLVLPGDIEMNLGLPRTMLTVANTGDRPVQVGSHYHCPETNPALFLRPSRPQGPMPGHQRRPLRTGANAGDHPHPLPGPPHRHRLGHRNYRRWGGNPHRRRNRRAYPFHLLAADGDNAIAIGITTQVGDGTGPKHDRFLCICTK